MLSSVVLLDHQDAQKAWAALLLLHAVQVSDRPTKFNDPTDSTIAREFGCPIGDVEELRRRYQQTQSCDEEDDEISFKHLASLRARPENISIHRSVTNVIESSATDSSLLIVGEPGAGKSGVLYELATKLERTTRRMWYSSLSIDSKVLWKPTLVSIMLSIRFFWSGKVMKPDSSSSMPSTRLVVHPLQSVFLRPRSCHRGKLLTMESNRLHTNL